MLLLSCSLVLLTHHSLHTLRCPQVVGSTFVCLHTSGASHVAQSHSWLQLFTNSLAAASDCNSKLGNGVFPHISHLMDGICERVKKRGSPPSVRGGVSQVVVELKGWWCLSAITNSQKQQATLGQVLAFSFPTFPLINCHHQLHHNTSMAPVVAFSPWNPSKKQTSGGSVMRQS